MIILLSFCWPNLGLRCEKVSMSNFYKVWVGDDKFLGLRCVYLSIIKCTIRSIFHGLCDKWNRYIWPYKRHSGLEVLNIMRPYVYWRNPNIATTFDRVICSERKVGVIRNWDDADDAIPSLQVADHLKSHRYNLILKGRIPNTAPIVTCGHFAYSVVFHCYPAGLTETIERLSLTASPQPCF